MLGIKEESRVGVIQALWNYIKVHGLQDKVDRRIIHADEYLRPVRCLYLCSCKITECPLDIERRIYHVPTDP